MVTHAILVLLSQTCSGSHHSKLVTCGNQEIRLQWCLVTIPLFLLLNLFGSMQKTHCDLLPIHRSKWVVSNNLFGSSRSDHKSYWRNSVSNVTCKLYEEIFWVNFHSMQTSSVTSGFDDRSPQDCQFIRWHLGQGVKSMPSVAWFDLY